MSPQPGPECPAQALPAKDMPLDYNCQPEPQGYEVAPARAVAPNQPQTPAYSVPGPLGGYSIPGPSGGCNMPPNAPQAGGIWQPENIGPRKD